ncbi:MAG: hydrogenase iron-sulfur subunit [Candidatus Brocadiae bacterium]|nr:hydrogenase iron-sulfur subunit [Candidatus Brocadiia bacterium]
MSTSSETDAGTEQSTAGAVAGGDFEPRLVAFVCNWCTYAGADLAGTSRLKYASNVRVFRVPCSGRIDPLFLVKAFERGADGILVSGCHPGDCHYAEGNYYARRRFAIFRELMQFLGIEQERLQFSWISAAEGAKWADTINNLTAQIRALGPFEGYKSLVEASQGPT